MRRILITGSGGYVGAAVIPALRREFPSAVLIGLDNQYFANRCYGGRAPESYLNQLVVGDIRDVGTSSLEGVTDVIFLAALSNDPMGSQYDDITEEVNRDSTIRLAQLAKEKGCLNFVFASSASVYGVGGEELRSEASQLQPLTAYARSKVETEAMLEGLATDSFRVSCLRFATACGWSERPRLDLVLNDFVASALQNGEIRVLSDGSPSRPLVHVRDMSRAIVWACGDDRIPWNSFEAVNVGQSTWNFTIGGLAKQVASYLGGVKVWIDPEGNPDPRSYRLDFAKWRELAPNHQPRESLEDTVRELSQNLLIFRLTEQGYRRAPEIRLTALQELQAGGQLDQYLRWMKVQQ